MSTRSTPFSWRIETCRVPSSSLACDQDLAGLGVDHVLRRVGPLQLLVVDPHRLHARLAEGADGGVGDLLALDHDDLGAGDRDVLAGAQAHEALVHRPVDGVAEVEAIDRVERPDDLLGALQAEGAQEHRRGELALPVDPDVQEVLRVVLELDPRAAVRDDLRDVEGLVLGVEERARRAVELRDDDALGPVDDERAVLGHQRDVAEVDLLLLDVADGLHPRLGVLVPDDEADGDLQRHGVGHAAFLALVHVVLQLQADRLAADVAHVAPRLVGAAAARAEHLAVAVGVRDQRGAAVGARLAQVVQARQLAALALPVADRVLDELERGVLAEVGDREHRLEDRLQPGVLALGRQPVHLQEPLVGVLLDLDQVRDRDRRLDLREVDALSVNVLGKAVHPVKVPTTAPRRTGRDGLPASGRVVAA